MPYEFIPQSEYLLIHLKGNTVDQERPTISSEFSKKLEECAKKFVVVQCGECGEMNPALMRELAQMFRHLKTINGRMCLVGVNDKIKENIKKNGLDRILACKMSLRGALVEFGLAKERDFDVNFINPFLGATIKVLKVQCFLEAKPQKPYLKKPTDPMLMGDLSGIIGLTSEAFAGTMAISFPASVFLKLASNMLGEKFSEITPQIVDLAGELSNMILGQAKIELSTLGYIIQQALPSCVWGKDHQVKTFGGGACIVLPFATADGIFHVEVASNQSAVLAQPKKAA